MAALAPSVEASRRRSKRPPQDLRRALEGVLATEAAWPSAYCGPNFALWRAQLFVRWSRFGTWQRLLELAQAGGVDLGSALLDGR
jgi:hypothetical protein